MKRIFLCILFLIVSLVKLLAQNRADVNIDSLLKLLPKNQTDTVKIDVLNELSFAYSNMNPDSGIIYGEKALQLARKVNHTKLIAEAMNSIAVNYASKSDYSKALEYHFSSLKLREQTGDKINTATSLANIGIVYDSEGDLKKALEYYERALSIFEAEKNKRGIATTLGNIGLIFTRGEDHEKALDYITRSLKLEEELGDQNAVAGCLGNIGNIYLAQNDYLKALEFDTKALQKYREYGDKAGEAINLCNIGEIYYHIAADTNSSLLNTLFNGNKNAALQKAIEYLSQSNLLFASMGYDSGMQESFHYLSLTNELVGDYKTALKNLQQEMMFKDSIFNVENRNRIARLESGRDLDLREKEIEIQKLQLDNVRTQRWYFIGGLVLLAALLFVMLNRIRLKKKNSEELQLSLEKIKYTQDQLIQQEKLASLGQMAAGIAHEIHNPLNFVNNFSDVSKELVDEFMEAKDDEERAEIAEMLKSNLAKITQHGKRADSIVRGMLMHSRNSPSEKQLVSINDICEEAFNLSYHAMRAKNPGFNCEIEKLIDERIPKVYIMQQELSRVILNLLNNAFFAVEEKNKMVEAGKLPAEYKPKVYIQTQLRHNTYSVVIHDNGIGIPEEIRNKIFLPFFTTKSAGEGTGLGLSLSYDIILAHGGEIRVNTKEMEFTKFILILPIE